MADNAPDRRDYPANYGAVVWWWRAPRTRVAGCTEAAEVVEAAEADVGGGR
jgi:hypothetical protein